MSWCPKCKTEYRAGIEVCSDCGSHLVESLDQAANKDNLLLLMSGDDFQIKMIAEHLTKEGFSSVCVKEKEEKVAEGNIKGCELYVSPDEMKDAVACAAQFMKTTNPQAEEVIKNPASQRVIMKKEPVSNRPFTEAKERSKDMKATGIMLLAFGIAGAVFIVLVALEIIPIYFYGFKAVIAYSVMILFFGTLLVSGVSTLLSARKLVSSNEEESKQFNELDKWVEDNLSKKIIDEKIDASSMSEEQSYFERMDYMKEELVVAFPELQEDMIDYDWLEENE